MRNIYTVGEAIYDIIFMNSKPIDAKVGGAMINSSVSLGRLGLPVNYVGDTAKDAVGSIMREFLIDNKVNIDHFSFYENSKSRLALAFIDDCNAPKYSFYKINTPQKIKLDFPEIKEDDIILFGSFYSIKTEVRGALVDFLIEAKSKNAIIIYDPNFRPNHKSLLSTVLPFIEDNIRFADIIKASNEDFNLIFGSDNFDQVIERIEHLGPKSLIYTRNQDGIDSINNGERSHIDVEKLKPISAVGAGDTFNAGLIYYIYKNNITKAQLDNLSPDKWKEMLSTADKFAANVCMSNDNYISMDFVKKF